MTAADPDESSTPIMPTCVKNGSSTQGGLSGDVAPAKLSQDEPACLKESTGLQSIKPHPGCLILGNDAQRGNKYVTRYRIDHQKQRIDVTFNTRHEVCCPCLIPEKRSTWGKLILTLLTCEPFILTLHIIVLVLGVLKEALNLRTVDEDIHLVHSVVETFVACLVVVSRLTAAWNIYHDCKRHRTRTQYGHGRTNARPTQIFTAVCVILILGNIVTTLLFYFFAHLGWTILSNNFVLLVVTVSFTLATDRLNNHLARDKTDQHKAVIREMMMFSDELRNAIDKDHDHQESPSAVRHRSMNPSLDDKHPSDPIRDVSEKMQLFSRAIRDTDMFNIPDYIDCPSEMKTFSLDIVTHMEMQSLV